MRSMSKLNITIQEVTQEIIDIMSMNEFPQIIFVIKGYFEGLIRNLEVLESHVFYFQDMIEMWYMDRKRESWMLRNTQFPIRILINLKSNRIRNFPLVSLVGEVALSTKYYKDLLESYIRKLTLIKCVLVKWLRFLFLVEDKLYTRTSIHDSLKLVFL